MRDISQSTYQQKTPFSIFHVVLFVYNLETCDGGRDLKKKRQRERKRNSLTSRKRLRVKMGLKESEKVPQAGRKRGSLSEMVGMEKYQE